MFANPNHPEVKPLIDKWLKKFDELNDTSPITLHNEENNACCEAKEKDKEISKRLQKKGR